MGNKKKKRNKQTEVNEIAELSVKVSRTSKGNENWVEKSSSPNDRVPEGGEGGGVGTSLYGLYRYVRPQRIGFFSRFGHRVSIFTL